MPFTSAMQHYILPTYAVMQFDTFLAIEERRFVTSTSYIIYHNRNTWEAVDSSPNGGKLRCDTWDWLSIVNSALGLAI